jgi:aminoglycoside phosphotransferase (APT) family kinase protein
VSQVTKDPVGRAPLPAPFLHATWTRARARALSIALIALPYYRDTAPNFGARARYTIDQVLADYRAGV